MAAMGPWGLVEVIRRCEGWMPARGRLGKAAAERTPLLSDSSLSGSVLVRSSQIYI